MLKKQITESQRRGEAGREEAETTGCRQTPHLTASSPTTKPPRGKRKKWAREQGAPPRLAERHPGRRGTEAVAPVAYQVILEPGIGQFREFEPRQVHTRINSLGLFLVRKLTWGKRESVS